MRRIVLGLWRSKWGLARLVVASVLLWAFAAETGGRLARMQLAALPGFDYLASAEELRSQGRFSEALQVIDAGLDTDSAADGAAREALRANRARVESERADWLRKAKDAGWGALTGQGKSLESLLGAVTADFFLFGDVRDLLIQGTKLLVDGDSDELILLLSTAGVVTTLAPEIDWAPSLLKIARKAGALSSGVAEALLGALRAGDKAKVVEMVGDAAALSKRASPAGAVRLLRVIETPAELKAAARFSERAAHGPFALGVTGRTGLDTVLEAGQTADTLVVKAAHRGAHGTAFLRTPAARALLRPHPLIGVAKGLTKGTLPALAIRAIEAMDAKAWWFVPMLAAWVFVEGAVIVRRVVGVRDARLA
ncbi:MAG: hypothetical protein ACKVZJ_10560 [Phycisphaerales bacterium]